MRAVAKEQEMPPDIAGELQVQHLRIKGPISAKLMWDRLFSEDDRQQFGNDLEGAYHKHGTPGMFSLLRGVSLPRAVADVAFKLEFLTPQKYQWLLRGMGDHGAKVRAQTSPNWDSKAGILTVDGKTVRELRITAEPSKLQQILDAFQDAGWVSRIENPLPSAVSQLGIRVGWDGVFWQCIGNQGGLPCKKSISFACRIRNATHCGRW